MTSATCPNGFTLIEVVVALAVTSTMLVVIMNGALTAKERMQRSSDRDRAVLVASGLIVGQNAAPAEVIERKGRSGNLTWTLTETELARDPRGFFVLDRIEVRMSDRTGRPFYAVATRKLKPLVAP